MTIGLNNIFTSLWFLLMLSSGGTLSYISIENSLFTTDLILIIKLFLGILILITVGIAVFFFIKFRLLLIDKESIISLNPFIFNIKRIRKKEIEAVTWKVWEIKATVYKTVEIKDTYKRKISFSDFEFENFDILASQLPNVNSSSRKSDIYYQQARSNISFATFLLMINIAFLAFLIFQNISKEEFHLVDLVFYSTTAVLIYASLRRRKSYSRIIKGYITKIKAH